MKQCPLCGSMMPDDANYCSSCMGDNVQYDNSYINNTNYTNNNNYAPPTPAPNIICNDVYNDIYNNVGNMPTFSVTQIAKEYGKSAVWLNSYLRDKGIQIKQGDVWVLTPAFANQGYTTSKSYNINGSISKQHTYWTPKGKLFINQLLETDGYFKIVPLNNQPFYPQAQNTNNLPQTVQDKATVWELALSAIVPPFGFIYGAIINKSRPKTSQKLIAVAVVGLIFRGIF